MDFSLGYTEAAPQTICGNEQGFLEFAQSLYKRVLRRLPLSLSDHKEWQSWELGRDKGREERRGLPVLKVTEVLQIQFPGVLCQINCIHILFKAKPS